MIKSGTTVSKVLKTLKIVAPVPVKKRSTESRAKMISEVAPCSKDIQKKTVKKAKMITAINLSRTILA